MNNPQLAMVFPGQGSQAVGMLQELAAQYPLVQQTFAEASAVLNYDLWQLIVNGPEELLNQTENTQPALLTAGVAVWRIWQNEKGVNPAYMAGHSLGEYTALVCAGALDFKTAVMLVRKRGQFMQEAVPLGVGAMAAIVGLENKIVNDICQQASNANAQVSPANFNSIGQVVIAGNTQAVNTAIELAKTAGAKIAKLLPMSVPSHCQLMYPAAQRLAAELAKINFQDFTIPVINNVDVVNYFAADKIKDALVRQLYSPVRWVETIDYFAQQGVEKIIECGPGKVLAGLNKRIVASIQNFSINTPETLMQTLATMNDNATELEK